MKVDGHIDMYMNYAQAICSEPPTPVLKGDDPLPVQIASYIRHQIIHDILKPGEPIRERAIAEQLNVSRTPMRDALKILSVERLVDLIPNRGAVVVQNSVDDIAEMLSVYIELEVIGGMTACRMAGEGDFLRVEHQLRAMESAEAAVDRIQYFRANQAFHLAIIAASRNKTLIEIHGNLSLRLYRIRYLSILTKGILQSRAAEHRELFDTLRSRDSARMAALQKEHFRLAWRLLDDLSRNE